jgi:hypothetical protein
VISDHAYKDNQESISFALNFKQHLSDIYVFTFATDVVVPGAATNPKTTSHLSRANETYEKYL